MQGEEGEGWISYNSQARSTRFIGALRTESWSPEKKQITGRRARGWEESNFPLNGKKLTIGKSRGRVFESLLYDWKFFCRFDSFPE